MPWLVTDFDTDEILEAEGDIDARWSPCSTFKIPLALMGFDSGILHDAKNPVWPFAANYEARVPVMLESWRQSFDPMGWMHHSCLWYSQVITETLGAEKFAHYLREFDYGNGDISGDPGKNNGLTNSWLVSSLQISPREQVQFLRRLLLLQLPVSESALAKTAPLIFAGDLAGGRMFGKTGSGYTDRAAGKQRGWFIGWCERGQRRLLFAALVDHEGPGFAGHRARALMTDVLEKLVSNSEDVG
ncbi:MAG TPA: penicillin-binding transpeptidase domain-containing protein [Patescibacteria group bacterium]|nr:penicillin-binding transpeptidase domain-containing protein [Patescibacteria group bacterium]